MSKIFANFNLNKSLHNFQVNVTELLELNNIAQWTGITLLEREEKIREVDFYHATEHLQGFADAAFNEEKERKTCFFSARKALKNGEVDELLKQMKYHKKSSRGFRRKIMTNQINYFNKQQNKGLLNFNKISQLNLPIGSGAVESLIRQAVNLRLKGNGTDDSRT